MVAAQLEATLEGTGLPQEADRWLRSGRHLMEHSTQPCLLPAPDTTEEVAGGRKT